MRRFIVLVLELFLLFLAPVAFAREWHVYDAGTDPAGCTGATSISDAFRTVQKGVNCMQAGDVVLVHGGTYNTTVAGGCSPANTGACKSDAGGNIGIQVYLAGVFDKQGGNSGARYMIRAAPGETPVLDGGGVWDAAFFVSNSPYVTIDGFTIQNFTASSKVTGPRAGYGTIVFNASAADGEILNNRISGTDPQKSAGVEAADINLHTAPKRMRVGGNAITSHMRNVIYTSGPSGNPTPSVLSEIFNNRITQTLDAGNPKGPLRAMSAIRTHDVKFTGNYVENVAASKVKDSAALFIRDESDVLVEGNVFLGYGRGVVVQDELGSGSPANEEERHRILNNTLVGYSGAGPEGIFTTGAAASCDGCEIRGNGFMDFERGIRIRVPSTDPWPSFTTIGNNTMYRVLTPTSVSSDTVIENNNDFTASSLLIIPPPPQGFVSSPPPPLLSQNTAPSVNAGVDRSGVVGQGITVAGTATDDVAVSSFSLSVSVGCTASGQSTSGIGTRNASGVATVTCTNPGIYTITMTARDSGPPQLTGSDTLTLTITTPLSPAPQPPLPSQPASPSASPIPSTFTQSPLQSVPVAPQPSPAATASSPQSSPTSSLAGGILPKPPSPPPFIPERVIESLAPIQEKAEEVLGFKLTLPPFREFVKDFFRRILCSFLVCYY